MGVQQRVEIIKLLYREADILILDEPTAVLTPQEIDELFKVIRNLLDRGKSIIFINQKISRWGLRTRAVGEHPKAANILEVRVYFTRCVNTVPGGWSSDSGGHSWCLARLGDLTRG